MCPTCDGHRQAQDKLGTTGLQGVELPRFAPTITDKSLDSAGAEPSAIKTIVSPLLVIGATLAMVMTVLPFNDTSPSSTRALDKPKEKVSQASPIPAKITGATVPVESVSQKAQGKRGIVQPLVDLKRDTQAQWESMRPRLDGRGMVELETSQWQQQVRASARPTLWEMFGAAVAGTTSQRIWKGMRRNVFAEAYTTEPGFVPDTGIPEAQNDPKLFNDLLSARSQREYDDLVARSTVEEARMAALYSRGAALGIALSLGAELTSVPNLIPGIALLK